MSSVTDIRAATSASDRGAGSGDGASRVARQRARRGTVRYHGLMIVAALTWFIPILWMLSMALTPNDVLQQSSTSLLPGQVTASNFLNVFSQGDLGRWFLNSFAVTILTTVVTVLI